MNTMKKIFFSILAVSAVLAGCNREVIEQQGSGSLAIDLSCNSDYQEVTTKASDDDIINNLSIDIKRPFDNWSINYSPFSSIKGKVVELGSGDYILTASSPDKADAAFEQPIYSGSKDFSIHTGQVTTVALQCAITNVKVTVNLSSNFVSELSDYTVTVTNGKGSLSWNRNAAEDDFKPTSLDGKTYYTGAESGYFTVGDLTVTVNGHRAIDGTDASTILNISGVKAADHHILNIDANVTGQLGGDNASGITITISHDVNDIDQPVVVPGFEEIPVEGDKPSEDEGDNGEDNSGEDGSGDGNEDGSGDGNEGETPVPVASIDWAANPTLAPMNINDNLNADLVISVPGKIATFVVDVDSPQLTAAIEGLTYDESSKMNLITDEGLIAFLSEAAPSLPTSDRLLGETQVNFFLTDLVKLISMYDTSAGDRHNFTLNITDENGGEYEVTLTFISE